MNDTITVHENGHPLTYSLAELTAYHGFGFPGGVAHGLKVMQRAFPLISPDQPPERREIAIRTPFKGPGARDAFEMVTRAVSEGRYVIDDSFLAPERGDILKAYVFIILYRGHSLKLTLREGIAREDFVVLGRKPERSAAENARLAALKTDMAERLLALSASAAYDVHDLQTGAVL